MTLHAHFPARKVTVPTFVAFSITAKADLSAFSSIRAVKSVVACDSSSEVTTSIEFSPNVIVVSEILASSIPYSAKVVFFLNYS